MMQEEIMQITRLLSGEIYPIAISPPPFHNITEKIYFSYVKYKTKEVKDGKMRGHPKQILLNNWKKECTKN